MKIVFSKIWIDISLNELFMILGEKKTVYPTPTDEIYAMDVPKFMNFHIKSICLLIFRDFLIFARILSTGQIEVRNMLSLACLGIFRTPGFELHGLVVRAIHVTPRGNGIAVFFTGCASPPLSVWKFMDMKTKMNLGFGSGRGPN